MNNTSMLAAVAVAAVAAVGNALFAFGQRKSVPSSNPFIFLICALSVCLALFLITYTLFEKVDVTAFVRVNLRWFLISGAGFFLTFIGFYLLYTHFGASYYVVYAVLSILTTSLIVGMLLVGEPINRYHLLSMLTAILTIILFSIGNAVMHR